MWKAVIKVAMTTIGVLAIVLAGTAMLIEASTVDVATSRSQVTKSCRAAKQTSLPHAPLLPDNIPATTPDALRHRHQALPVRKASLEG